MRYLIDGYNLFFYLREEVFPLQQSRHKFLQDLEAFFRQIHVVCTIVFDSHVNYATYFPSKKQLPSLEVLFSPKELSADDYIIEHLLFEKNLRNITVVTSDRELLARANRVGAKTQTIDRFCHLMVQKRKRKKIPLAEKREIVESRADYQRLLLLFQERLQELEDNEDFN